MNKLRIPLSRWNILTHPYLLTAGLVAIFFISIVAIISLPSITNGSTTHKLSTNRNPFSKAVLVGSNTNQQNTSAQTVATSSWSTALAANYSIKYPSNWFTASGDGITITNSNQTIFTSEKITAPSEISLTGIYIEVSATSQLSFLDQQILNNPNGVVHLQLTGDEGSYSTSEIYTKYSSSNISGYPTFYYTDDFSASPQENMNYGTTYVINKPGAYLVIKALYNKGDITSAASVLQQIVNSVSFN